MVTQDKLILSVNDEALILNVSSLVHPVLVYHRRHHGINIMKETIERGRHDVSQAFCRASYVARQKKRKKRGTEENILFSSIVRLQFRFEWPSQEGRSRPERR